MTTEKQTEFPFTEVFERYGLYWAKKEWDGVDAASPSQSEIRPTLTAGNIHYGSWGQYSTLTEGLVYTP